MGKPSAGAGNDRFGLFVVFQMSGFEGIDDQDIHAHNPFGGTGIDDKAMALLHQT